jgi:hypothetical protein
LGLSGGVGGNQALCWSNSMLFLPGWGELVRSLVLGDDGLAPVFENWGKILGKFPLLQPMTLFDLLLSLILTIMSKWNATKEGRGRNKKPRPCTLKEPIPEKPRYIT